MFVNGNVRVLRVCRCPAPSDIRANLNVSPSISTSDSPFLFSTFFIFSDFRSNSAIYHFLLDELKIKRRKFETVIIIY